MADKPSKYKPVPPVEFRFKPGQSGNPSGRTPFSAEQRALRKLTLEKYRKVIKIALKQPFEDLVAFSLDGRNSTVEVGVARLLIHAINSGNTSDFELFAARIVGKIPDVLEIAGEIKTQHNVKVSVQKAKEMIEKCRSKV